MSPVRSRIASRLTLPADLGGIRTSGNRYIVDRQLYVCSQCEPSAPSDESSATEECAVATVVLLDVASAPRLPSWHWLGRPNGPESSDTLLDVYGPLVAETLRISVNQALPMLLCEPDGVPGQGFATAALLGSLGVSAPAIPDHVARLFEEPALAIEIRRLLVGVDRGFGSMVRYALQYGVDAATLGELRFRYIDR